MIRLADMAAKDGQFHVVISIIDGIGDGFLARPLIRFVTALFPQSSVTVWGSQPYGRTVFAEFCDRFFPLFAASRRDASYKKAELARLLSQITFTQALCWISLDPYHPLTETEQHVLSHLKPAHIWSYGRRAVRRDMATERRMHQADQYFRLIGEPGVAESIGRRPVIGVGHRTRASAFRDVARQQSKLFIATHAETGDAKEWNPPRWAVLVERFFDRSIFVLLGRPEQPLVAFLPKTLLVSDERQDQLAILFSSDMFVGIDSCFAHIADAFEIPGVVLFGPTSSEEGGPRAAHLIALTSNTGQMSDISIDELTEVVQRQVDTLTGGAMACDMAMPRLLTQYPGECAEHAGAANRP